MNVYSDVVNAGYILPKKNKYTMADVNKVMAESLFKPYNGSTIDIELAVFICKCSAVFHDTAWSKEFDNVLNKKRQYKIG